MVYTDQHVFLFRVSKTGNAKVGPLIPTVYYTNN